MDRDRDRNRDRDRERNHLDQLQGGRLCLMTLLLILFPTAFDRRVSPDVSGASLEMGWR